MYHLLSGFPIKGKRKMEMHIKGDLSGQMRQRTFELAVIIHNILKRKEITNLGRSTVNQLIRSSTSVAANYRAATRARSDTEFFSKICIVVEECDETLFWLDFLVRIKVFTSDEIEVTRNETELLLRIFSSTKITMKRKIHAKK
jgi:four helix bundle protein